MSDLELSKKNILTQLKGLCAHCTNRRSHSCRIQRIALQIKAIHGVPLIVNNEFKGVLWA
jgi:hypothetical protein